MLITLEPRGIFGSIFCIVIVLILSSHLYANGDEALPIIVSEYTQEIPQSQTADKSMAPQGRATQTSIILDGQYILVKMLKTFEPHCIF